VYISSNLAQIAVTLPTTINSYKLADGSTAIKYTLSADQFVVEVYFNYTISFIGTTSGKVYKKIISTNSTDFNITLQLLYSHSAKVEGLFVDNCLNLISQDVNLVLMGYDVNLNASVSFDSSFSSKQLSEITFINNEIYFIFYTDILQVSYNSATKTYSTINITQTGLTVAPLHAVPLDVKTN
jgi:hypothetical protein